MSGAGAPAGRAFDAAGLKVAIVASSWHEQVMNGLINGAQAALRECNVTPDVFRVPGSFELPIVVSRLTTSHDAVVALGVVIRGGTPHFDYVCSAATEGLSRIALETGVPVGFGLLTCDNDDQALDRAGLPGSREDKGREAALAAVETALLLRSLGSQP